jgi:ubiquinone/menaquinone biosynthesis C-methylase UbiE
MFKTTIWDYWADKYDSLWVQKYSLGPTRKAIVDALLPILDKDKKYKILDMGCGTGQLLREIQAVFKDFNIEYTGIDISHKMIEICRLKDSNADYFVSSIEDYKPLEGKYDIIICTHSFPYYPDKPKAINKFNRLLKKDGVLLLAQASANSLYDNFIMFFEKFTTSKAEYLSIPDILNLVKNKFREVSIVKIKEKVYMPTICLFLLGKGEKE